ncbi:hypothetical protein BGX26_004884, partial [Mortierella sp. AD094]
IIVIVAVDNGSKTQVLDALAERTFVVDGELAEQGAVLEVRTTHMAQAALVDLGEGDLETLDFAPRVTVERTGSGHGEREKSSKAEDGELHGIIIVVAVDDGGKTQVLDALAERTFVVDGELAEQGAVLEVGTTHMTQAALVDLGEGDLETLDLAPRVAIERTRGGHSKREKSSMAEDGELHGDILGCFKICG